MSIRKPLSKRTRFEVFKRDRFTCQYCGKMAPDVILEVDHIVPVAEGGGDEITNLITSCMDCNRGKGKRKLSDDAVIKKQQAQLVELAEKREQYEMIALWKQELLDMEKNAAESALMYWNRMTYSDLPDSKLPFIEKIIREFGIRLVYDAMDIAYRDYYMRKRESSSGSLSRLGGICYNLKNGRNAWDKKG